MFYITLVGSSLCAFICFSWQDYTSRDLAGLTVVHDVEAFTVGASSCPVPVGVCFFCDHLDVSDSVCRCVGTFKSVEHVSHFVIHGNIL